MKKINMYYLIDLKTFNVIFCAYKLRTIRRYIKDNKLITSNLKIAKEK